MSDPKEEFMAAALKPIAADTEKRLGVWRWLGEILAMADESALRAATRRWNEVDSGSDRSWLRKIALGALVCAALFGAVRLPQSALDLEPLALASGSGTGRGDIFQRIGKGLDVEERLLLGDQSLSPLQRKEALVAGDPDNPAFFAEYAVVYHKVRGSLPPDYVETVNRLDPDNAWFDYFAASVVSGKAIERIKRTEEEKEAGVAVQWKTKQPDKVEAALVLLRNARSKNRFESYDETLLRQRIPLLPQGNQAERMISFAYVVSQDKADIRMRYLVDVICSQAWKAGEDADPVQFQQIAADAEHFLRNLGQLKDVSIIGELVYLAAASGISDSLANAAAKIGSEEDAKRWGNLSERFKIYNKERRSKERMEGDARRLMEKGGMISSLGGPMLASQLKNPPSVTDEDLKPARLMDHRLLGAVSARGVYGLLAICSLAVFIYHFRGPKPLRLVVMRGVQLLKMRDWLWVWFAGVLLPVVFVISVSWFTPAGGSALSIKMTMREPMIVLPAAHYLALFLMLAILPVLIARWRLSIRASAFGFAGMPWVGWAAVVGLVFYVVGYLYVHWVVMSLMLLLALVWLLVTGGLVLFGRATGLLRRLMVARVILPAYLLGMICMTVVSAVSMASYQEWFKKDDFMRLSPEAPAESSYEYKIAKQMREEINGMLQLD